MEKEIIFNTIRVIKEKSFDNWKLTTALLVLAMAANLLYVRQNLISEKAYTSEVSIFKTYKTTGNSFYKRSDSKKWLFLSGEEILTAGSELQTDENSHVILSFLGQSGRIELSEKTHLAVIKKGRETILDFRKGEAYINYQASSNQKPLYVKIDQKVFKITNADLYVRGDTEDIVQVAVEYGKAVMMADEQTITFEKGQAIFFKSEKDYLVEESKFKISTPFNYDRYNLQAETFPVRFAFASFKENYKFQLFVGEKSDELKPVFDQPQVLAKNEIVLPLKKGSYYWQLGAYDQDGLSFSSHVKRFFVEPEILIQLVKPAASAKFQMVDGKAAVQFQWDNPSQLEKVFIEVSEKKDFSTIMVHEAITENNYFNYEFENSGDYYWRVSGFRFGTSDLLPSAVGKISVVNEVIPQQVKVLFPKDKTILTTLSLKNSDITFQWTKNPATKTYNVEIKSLLSGKTHQYETKDAQIKVDELPEGSYQWRVLDKESGISSAMEEFYVVQTRRLNFANEQEGSGYLSWQSGPRGTAKYRVEALRIGSRSDFNAFFDQTNSTKKSLEITGDKISYKNFSPGIYAFKVYALDSDRKILADSNLKFLKVRD